MRGRKPTLRDAISRAHLDYRLAIGMKLSLAAVWVKDLDVLLDAAIAHRRATEPDKPKPRKKR